MKSFYIFLSVSLCLHALIFAVPFKFEEKKVDLPAGFIINTKTNSSKKTIIKQKQKPVIEKNVIAENIKKEPEKEVYNEPDNQIENEDINEYEIGSHNGPKFKSEFKPVYPAIMKKMNIEGEVILKLLIDENGNMVEYNVIKKTNDIFLKSVLNELEKVSFEPANIYGRYVKSYGIIKIKFQLED